ncbi:MAG: hypothetical protein HXY52_09160, partial [Nitrospirae bacterium]|nr:hypothetical protein [Nitrospirota bacterium]
TATLNITAVTPPALAVLPGSITVNGAAPADTVTYTIFGGTPPYNIFTNNPLYPPSVTTVNASGGTFNVTVPAGSSAGSATYTIRDTTGATVAATLTITASTDPLVIIPGSQSVVAPNTVTFSVSGGTSPYVITSSDPSSACNSTDDDCSDPGATGDSGIWDLVSAGSFIVTIPSNAVAGNVTINVYDSTGANKSATLTIFSGGVATITVNPASISVTGLSSNADNVTFIISGGTGPYTAFSSNTAVAEIVSPITTSFTVDPKVVAASTAATLTVVDSNGLSKTATITVTPMSSSMAINPSTIAVKAGTIIYFHIIGGLPNYTIYSSDTAIVGFTSNPLIQSSDTFQTLPVAAGNATITVVDSDGKTVTAAVTVNP